MSSSANQPRSKKIVLFHRDFRRFTGGHLKVWDYFNHVAASTSFEPRIAFSPESKWDETNPWVGSRPYVVEWNPAAADILFLAGMDWRALPKAEARKFSKPIINLIQHPRHAEPNDELYRFLSNRAIRICVSEQVADVIKATGKVKGPVFAIANGIDLGLLPKALPIVERSIDVLICGMKAPDLATRLYKAITTTASNVTLLNDWVPRTEYLAKLNDAKIAVMIPRDVEGFYLPALEAMACGAIIVCPDCVGNRDFCQDQINCFRPDYSADEITDAVRSVLSQSEDDSVSMLEKAAKTVSDHSLSRERASFLQILDRVDELWNTNR